MSCTGNILFIIDRTEVMKVVVLDARSFTYYKVIDPSIQISSFSFSLYIYINDHTKESIKKS